jgi:hypothetical protein
MNRKRLQEVLRVRSLQERGARGELARRTQRHREAVTAERRTWERLDDEPSQLSTDTSLAAMRAIRDAGMLAAASQHQVSDEALESSLVAREQWTVAARRVEALDRLGVRLQEADDAEAERKQILEIDDLVLARRGRDGSQGAREGGAA